MTITTLAPFRQAADTLAGNLATATGLTAERIATGTGACEALEVTLPAAGINTYPQVLITAHDAPELPTDDTGAYPRGVDVSAYTEEGGEPEPLLTVNDWGVANWAPEEITGFIVDVLNDWHGADTASSASRQHYIDTGAYFTTAEVWAPGTPVTREAGDVLDGPDDLTGVTVDRPTDLTLVAGYEPGEGQVFVRWDSRDLVHAEYPSDLSITA